MGKSRLWKRYGVEGGKVTRKLLSCPRCGTGFMMADHGDRYTCGNCKYTQFKSAGA